MLKARWLVHPEITPAEGHSLRQGAGVEVIFKKAVLCDGEVKQSRFGGRVFFFSDTEDCQSAVAGVQ